MDLYYYCSYDGSPVGFRIGRVDAFSQEDKYKELSNEDIEPFIRRCFETGLVRSAFGKIPTALSLQKKYFLLKKKMVGRRDNCNYYMNIAVVEEKWDKFYSLMRDSDEEEKLTKAVMNSIEPIKDDAFGYRVDTHKLSDILSLGYASMCNSNNSRMQSVRQDNIFFATLSTESPDTTTLRTSLGIAQINDGEKIEIVKESEKMFRFRKKKPLKISKRIILILAIAIVVGIAALITILTKQ